MKRTIILILVAMALIAGIADAGVTFSWGTGSGTYLIYKQDGQTRLSPYQQTYTGTGCFVQLVVAYSNQVHPAVAQGNGASGGDEVLAVSWLGKGFIITTGGEFDGGTVTHNWPAGTKLYMRAWNAPSPDFNGSGAHTNASAPAGTNVLYGNSGLYTTLSNPSGPPASEEFTLDDLLAGFATTNTAVDTASPTVTITSPTNAASYSTTNSAINVAGTASDNVTVTNVSVANNRAIGGGAATGTTNWQYSALPLYSGTNYITVTAFDASGNTNTDTLVVNYTGDSDYEDVLRSGALVQEINFGDSLVPGSNATMQCKILSYAPVHLRFCTGVSNGWSLYKNAQYVGAAQSQWNIGGRHATVYSFQADYTVPQQPGDFSVWFNAAQMDGEQYMASVIPDGVDARPDPSQSKLIVRTILPGGTNVNPQSDTSFWDSSRIFETAAQYKKRSGATIISNTVPTNMVVGQSVTCDWTVLAYVEVNSKLLLINLAQTQIWVTAVGTQVGSPVDSSWHVNDRYGSNYYAKEYTFRTTFTVPNKPVAQQIYFLNQDKSDSDSWWMAGNIPAGKDPFPVSYNGMYGRFIGRTITSQ